MLSKNPLKNPAIVSRQLTQTTRPTPVNNLVSYFIISRIHY